MSGPASFSKKGEGTMKATEQKTKNTEPDATIEKIRDETDAASRWTPVALKLAVSRAEQEDRS